MTEKFLLDSGYHVEKVSPDFFVVELPGENKLKTIVSLAIGSQSLSVNAFVMRRPDENDAAVHRWLLEQNAKLFAISYAVDHHGDIYVTARLPLGMVDEQTFDQLFGAVHVACDQNFNHLLQIGFASSIKKEWAWRVSRGEPLTNLQAFAELVDAHD